jgi:hypothetical protein
MRNVSDKSCRGNKKTHTLCSRISFFENRAVEKSGTARQAKDNNIIRRK